MASTGSVDNTTSSDGCITPNSNANYDSDSKSDSNEDPQAPEEFHRCSVCKQPYCDPRVLICLHSFCLYCLEGMLVERDDQKYVQCRICTILTQLPTGSLSEDTKINFGLRRYIETLTFNHEDGLVCRSCKHGNLAIARCFDCAMFLCDVCTPLHKQLTLYTGHSVGDLGDSIKRPLEQRQCPLHPSHWATVYCHDCRQPHCDSCRHQHQSCKKTHMSDSSFAEWITNVSIEQRLSLKYADYYQQGLSQLERSFRITMEDLAQAKANIEQRLNQQFRVLQQQINQLVNDARSAAKTQLDAYTMYCSQLDKINQFMKVQSELALAWDNMQTKPFIENALQSITNLKPDTRRINFTFEFVCGDLDQVTQLGHISQINIQADQLNTTSQQQQPIARPTSINRSSVSSNYSSPGISQPANGIQGYKPSAGYNQNQAFKTNGHNQSSGFGQASGLNDYDQRSMPSSGFGQYQSQMSPSYQRSTSSPMTSSQPNSASLVNDNVFSFNNLSLNQNDGMNMNNSVQYSNYSSTANQNQSYQTWSNGVDRPSQTSSQPIIDVFSMSNNPMFEAPTPQRNNQLRSYPQIKRTRMQYMAKFGEYGNAEGQFTEPSGVAIDGKNRLVVADTNNHRIQIFDVCGNFLSQFGSSINSKLTYPNRIAVSKTSGKVVITERAPSHRVQTYTLHGQPLDIFGEEILQHPRGVTVDKDDNIIIVECKVMQVTIFSMQGKVLSRFGCSEHLQFPNSVAVNNKREIFISDNRAHNVKVFTYNGRLLRTIGCEGLTNYPIAVSINQREEVVVADNHNNFNLTVFTQEGELVAGYESKTKHAQCFDLALTDDGVAVLTSKDFKVYCYPYQDDCPYLRNQRRC